ncbi:MAG TPA: TIM barrel protein [Chitinophagaceae bacterium]|nr:TIM barrel protein [Chitinophagaceae bacterium]
MSKGFELKVFATNWGFAGSLGEYCARAKKDGYDGIEIWWPMEKPAQDELFAALDTNGLEVGFLCGSSQANWKEHLDSFRKMIDSAALNTRKKPLFINCHSGRDFFSYEENKAFIDHTTQLAKQTGITICHETHRSRMLFAAPVARLYMEKNPELRLTFDVSHWCNVSESFLKDQASTLELALQRTEHIHARIGHPEGPQVNDPRAPEWDEAVRAHLAWWDKIAERKKATGGRLTVLTEFGPPDYMPTLPYTRQPLGDQWAINVHMMHLVRKRYLS